MTLVFLAGMSFRDVFNGGSLSNLMALTTQEKERSDCSTTATTTATQENFYEWRGALKATLRQLTLNETVCDIVVTIRPKKVKA